MRIDRKTLITKARQFVLKSPNSDNFYARLEDKGVDPTMLVYMSCNFNIPDHEKKRGDKNYQLIKVWLKSWAYAKKISNKLPGLNYVRYKIANDITDGKITASELSSQGRHSYYKESRGIVSVYIEVPKGYISSIPISKYVDKWDLAGMDTTVGVSYEDIVRALGGDPIKVAGVKLMETGLEIVYK